MSTVSVTIQTLLQGFYSLLWIAILLDVGSPALDLRNVPEWSGAQLAIVIMLFVTMSFVVGIMVHTFSRNVFRRHKDMWTRDVLSSPAVLHQFRGLGSETYLRRAGAPTLEDVQKAEGWNSVRAAGEVMHVLDYALLVRAPHVYRSIQVYRDQYRLARGFVVPSVVLAALLPIWDPVFLLENVPHVGPLNVVGIQLFLLGNLFACVAFLAFRERAFRYAAARIRAFVTLVAGSTE